MAKLYVFGIGGTGSRVIKALTMLLASGVPMKNTDAVVPIIIDPDSSNGDLTRTIQILKYYKELQSNSSSEKALFFNTRIFSLDELGEGGFFSDNFKFDIDGVQQQLFREFIGYSELDIKNKAFASLLFSQSNLEADMEVGFKGNPNIGSVVLNKFRESPFFSKFASSFEQDDRVFIISSIFGGTGAAGFPLILKNIRNANHPIPHHNFLRNAKIGAVSVLPYFNVDKNDKTTIDSDTFISKTKAALSYYARNVSGNRSINALYYIGDRGVNDQKGADGSQEQRNRAHFIEMAAALAIVDFMEIPDTELDVQRGEATSPKFLEFGLKDDVSAISFGHLATETYDLIAKPITRFCLFKAFMQNHYDEVNKNRSEAYLYNGNNKLSKEALDSRFMDALGAFFQHYHEWLDEMGKSYVACDMIDLSKHGADIYNLVQGKPSRKGFLQKVLNGSGINHYRGVLSSLEPSLDYLNSPKKLVALFSMATDQVIKSEVKL